MKFIAVLASGLGVTARESVHFSGVADEVDDSAKIKNAVNDVRQTLKAITNGHATPPFHTIDKLVRANTRPLTDSLLETKTQSDLETSPLKNLEVAVNAFNAEMNKLDSTDNIRRYKKTDDQHKVNILVEKVEKAWNECQSPEVLAKLYVSDGDGDPCKHNSEISAFGDDREISGNKGGLTGELWKSLVVTKGDGDETHYLVGEGTFDGWKIEPASASRSVMAVGHHGLLQVFKELGDKPLQLTVVSLLVTPGTDVVGSQVDFGFNDMSMKKARGDLHAFLGTRAAPPVISPPPNYDVKNRKGAWQYRPSSQQHVGGDVVWSWYWFTNFCGKRFEPLKYSVGQKPQILKWE